MIFPPSINSFEIFGISIKFYGITMAIALICAMWTIFFIAKKIYKNKIDPDFLLDLFPIVIISGIIGARLYYVVLNLPFYLKHKEEIFAIWHGGLSIHGGIIFGIIAGVIYCKIKKQNTLLCADICALGLPIGQAIGRWGNFFNSEAYGLPTKLPWGLYIQENLRPDKYTEYNFFHPTFLYESILNLAIFMVLFYIAKKNQLNERKSGYVFFSYFILYAIVRFIVEGIRVDSVLNIGIFPIAQIASIIMFIIGITGILVLKKNDCRL